MKSKFFYVLIFPLIAAMADAAAFGNSGYIFEYQALKDKFISETDYIKLRGNGYQPSDIKKLRNNIFNGEIKFTINELIELKKNSYIKKHKIANNRNTAENLATEAYGIYKNNSHSYEAYRMYETAAAWLPRPEYLLILGDITFRMRLDRMKNISKDNSESETCTNNYKFAYDSTIIIINFYELGLGVAERLQMHDLKKTPLYRETRKKMACIDTLISHYSSETSKSCVPPEELEFCLAEPLSIDKQTR